jgi:hypothetical protein
MENIKEKFKKFNSNLTDEELKAIEEAERESLVKKPTDKSLIERVNKKIINEEGKFLLNS